MKDHLTEIIVSTVIFLAGQRHRIRRRPMEARRHMGHIDEWGLGGRQFGSWVTWFLVGGDLYTAYTFVAVPALLFAAGALGFFAVPYTVIVYPMVFVVLVRLWSVSRKHGFVTPADFVRARSGSSTMALLVAITGIVATMPYIALQLVGIESVLEGDAHEPDVGADRRVRDPRRLHLPVRASGRRRSSRSSRTR